MKLYEISACIEEFAPKNLALSFDNVGLNVGNINADITGVLLAVDVTVDAVNHAITNNCNLIISHHPVIFDPIKKIKNGDMLGDILLKAIANNINLYSAHTNMDNAENGINTTLGRILGLENTSKLMADGTGISGDIADITSEELKHLVSKSIIDFNTKLYGRKDKVIKKLGIISGSGGKMNEIAYYGLDAFITAEVRHSTVLEFLNNDVSVIEYGHYESEKIFMDIVYNLLKNTKKLDIDIFKYNNPMFNSPD